MASIGVPGAYRGPLVDLAQLEDIASDHLVEGVRTLPPYASVPEIEQVVRDAIGHEHAQSAGGIVASLLSLRGQLREATAADVAESLSRSDQLELDPEARERLERRVSDLLQTDAVATTAVAVDLQTQHHRNFQSARILTDIRPVFQEKVEDGPSGAVIVETLQLQTWSRDGNTEGFFIAMDEQDLVQLQSVVERALKKTSALRTFLEQHDLAYFELDKGGL